MWRSFHSASNASNKIKSTPGVETSLTKDQLKSFATTQLRKACTAEMLVFIKGFSALKESANYTQVVLCIAALGEVMSSCWKELESTKPQTLGKVSIVIESETDIPTLSVETEEANFMLAVESLHSVTKKP